ncbi:helix-turn-helix domain-containing protein [Dermacoccaceae bacterium W4C1]
MPRFVPIADVAETLSISSRQAYALVNSGELPAIKVLGGWRIESTELENYIQRQYEATRREVGEQALDTSD